MELLTRLRRDESGLATVEAAISLPVLLFVLFGIMEAGLLIYNYHLLHRACHEAARYCSLYSSGEKTCKDNVSAVVDSALRDKSGKSLLISATVESPEISITHPSPGSSLVSVTMTGTYKTIVGGYILGKASVTYNPITATVVADW